MRVLRLTPLLVAFALSACDKADNGDGGLAASPDAAYSLFDPVAASAVIPFPNDGLFGGTTDGTLNIPNGSSASFVDDANRLDGFSTVASAFTDFIGGIDTDTANAPGAVIVINTKTFAPLVPGVDYRVVSSSAVDPATGIPLNLLRTRLLIEPLKPLAPATTYLVAVTRAVRSLDGVPTEPADLFRVLLSAQSVDEQFAARSEPALTLLSSTQRATLEGVRQLYQARILPGLNAAGISNEALVIAWPFTTQSVGKTLERLQAQASAQPMQLIATGLTTQDVIPQLPPVADLYVGSLKLPYYLADASATAEDGDFLVNGAPDNPLNSFWHADPNVVADGDAPVGVPCVALSQTGGISQSTTGCFPQPLARATQTVPVLVTLPNANSGHTMPEGGWPVVIFQHGITGNRSQMLPLAPALAAAGFAVVAIDLPLHGVGLNDPLRVPGTVERTFDLDLVSNSTGAPPADGVVDASGTHFINLSSLLTSRDNLRQAVADLFTLNASLSTALILAPTESGYVPTGAALDGDTVRLVGHSLGGIVGGTLLGVNDTIGAATLAMPGGGIAKLLDGSASFGPRIAAGLAAASGGSIVEGNDNFETFLRFAQTAVDDADPINYASAAASLHPLHMIEVRGDAVVPNCSLTDSTQCRGADRITVSGYLSGTDPLARIMGLGYLPGPAATDGLDVPAAAQTITGAAARNNIVRFNQGDHGSILSPAASLDATCEMQGQTATFLATNGAVLKIGNPCPAQAAY
ncbi:hypothetical protein E4T66_02180 [Sinimarinibacterium sp. CAU 1509]|uniref:alpha/beta fold hydrolase n=1 Tax=Sinimarinibacterium sp. CAU 1509 TaxID=2562283 RepID=UPI0010AC2629|nr:alpha/beta fold hydrolase [Sinimarinibacterium sp. CAU 1509]TJY65052.1 hypothetical protein E4T66_02180 [Sinimarinibacterium sp. CAU 1509]